MMDGDELLQVIAGVIVLLLLFAAVLIGGTIAGALVGIDMTQLPR